MQKKAMELSLTFMVVVIISIVLFVFGVNFVYKVANQTNKIDKINTDELDKKFAQLSCESSDKVCIGVIKKIIPRGSFDTFGIKIINMDNATNFIVEVSPSKAFDKQENEILNNINFKYNNNSIAIDKNAEKSIGVAFEVSKEAASGTYVFDIVVKKNVNQEFQQYDNLEEVYVEVP